MLLTLTLKNFVLIDQVTIPFDKGFHVLTGETGAGKTLLVQAIYLLSGQKVSSDFIRAGEEKAVLEATFDIEKLLPVQIILNEAGIEYDPQEFLIIKREVLRSSKNRIFINSQGAPLSLLSQLGPLLLSLTEQSSAQSLRKGEAQRALVDTFGALHSDVLAFSLSYQEENKLKEELSRLERETPELQLEKLKWEADEWEAFQYKEGEEEPLFEEYKRLASFAETSEKLCVIQKGLDHPTLLPSLMQYQKLSSSEEELSEHLQSAIVHLQEASYLTSQTLENMHFEPLRYEELEKRLSTLNTLKKKYHLETSEIPAHLKKLYERIDTLENLDSHITSLNKKLSQKQEENKTLATLLSKKRKDTAQLLCSRLAEELKELNMSHAKVEIRIKPKEMGPYGFDEVSIYLAVNKGEAPASLQSKSSGGELSRFLFAMTVLLAEKTSLPTLVFDEIDSNVGGETATLVGQKLQSLGKLCQVLVITHFPQVARFADHHLQISKIENTGRTLTEIRSLEKNEIDMELLRMLGGGQGVYSPR